MSRWGVSLDPAVLAHWGPFPFIISWLRSTWSHLPRPKSGQSTSGEICLGVLWRLSWLRWEMGSKRGHSAWVYFCCCYCVLSWRRPWREWFKRKRCLSGSRFQNIRHTVLRSYCSGPVAGPFVTVGETEGAAPFSASGKDQDLKIPFRGTTPTQQWSKHPWLSSPLKVLCQYCWQPSLLTPGPIRQVSDPNSEFGGLGNNIFLW